MTNIEPAIARRVADLPGNERPVSTVAGRLRAGQPQRIITLGTSLTSERNWRVWRLCGGHWVGLLRVDLQCRFRHLATVANLARWGADSAWGVRKARRVRQRLIADAVLIEFAINDADSQRGISLEDSRRNLTEVLAILRSGSPACEIHLLVTNPVFGRHERSRPRLSAYYDAVRSVAREQHVGLIDTAPAWREALTQQHWQDLLPDGIHPAAEAARRVMLPEVRRALGL